LDEFEETVPKSAAKTNEEPYESTQDEATASELVDNAVPSVNLSEETTWTESTDLAPTPIENNPSESSDLLEQLKIVSRKLKEMPVKELERALEHVTNALDSLVQEFREYSAQRKALYAILSKLSGQGLHTSEEIFKNSIEHVEKLSAQKASEELVKYTVQANAILAKTDQFTELSKILGDVPGPPLLGTGITVLEKLLEQVHSQIPKWPFKSCERVRRRYITSWKIFVHVTFQLHASS
jgi:hypothetical protein